MADAYRTLLSEIAQLIEEARRRAARSVNTLITATYWRIGQRIVETEQAGEARAAYGEGVLKRLAVDLTREYGRGFSRANLEQMRRFFLSWPIPQTVSGKSDAMLPRTFPLPWSHYVHLLAVDEKAARAFYETEALRGGWTVRQLRRQIGTNFYERAKLAKNRAAALGKGQRPLVEDAVSPDEEVKDPYVLEFLNLRNEYSEGELEDALSRDLEHFLLELGGDFTFVGRQKRLRIDSSWLRIDLVFYHRRLRCLVILDLKIREFQAGDAGQMNLYLNYAKEHWTLPDENPPVGVILCAGKVDAVAQYALGGLPNKVIATEYLRTLPDEKFLAKHLAEARRMLQGRAAAKAEPDDQGEGEPG